VYDGIAQPLMESLLTHADRIYAFSEVWKTALLKYGPHPDVKVLEHAVDPMVYTNMTSLQRKEIRRSMNLPDTAVVFLNVNRNSERKRLDLTVGGFARILVSEPNAYLILASNLNPQAGAYYDLQRIFAEELKVQGLDPRSYANRLMMVDTSPPNLLDDGAINQLYNISDIGVNTSNGEGFGLCQLEHMYTGAPQLVTDVGTYSTFLPKTVATYIPENGRAYFAGGMPHGGWYPTFSMFAVADGMQAAIANLTDMRKAVADYQFSSWAKVCDGWLEDVITQAGHQATSVSVPVS
jgi:glycosyltransferase involved in cell wall biosynthesis